MPPSARQLSNAVIPAINRGLRNSDAISRVVQGIIQAGISFIAAGVTLRNAEARTVKALRRRARFGSALRRVSHAASDMRQILGWPGHSTFHSAGWTLGGDLAAVVNK
jgi:hypothetical protein